MWNWTPGGTSQRMTLDDPVVQLIEASLVVDDVLDVFESSPPQAA